MTLTIARLRSLAASLSFATVLSATLMAGVTLSITLPLAGCADKSAETALTINKTIKITRGEYDAVHDAFLKRLNLGVEGEKEKEAALKNTLLQEQIKQMTFNKLIFTALLNQDAKALNVSVSDADLKSYKDKNLAQIGGSEALDKVLKSEGMTQAEFDQNLRDEILIKKYVEAKAQRENLPLTVSDADAQQFYNAHKAMFNQPESVRASHILFKALPNIIKQDALQKNPKATEADIAREVSRIQGEKKKAAQETLAHVLKTPADFEKLARDKSDDAATGLFGGNLNMLTQQSADPSFWRAIIGPAHQLRPGDKAGKILPQVVQSIFGYHVVRVTGYRPAGQVPFAQVREELREQMAMQKRQAVLMAWMGSKRQGIELDFAPDLKPAGMDAAPGAGASSNPAKTPQNAAQARKAADAMGAAPPPAPVKSGG